jgi:putative peptide zinc metalloprotease protein
VFAEFILGNSEPPTANDALELVLADFTRVPLVCDVTIGRAPDSTVRLDDPAVSPRHARISVGDGEVLLEDLGSTDGTWLDGRRLDGRERLRDGSRIRVGDQELVVERHRDEDETGQTVLVPVGGSQSVVVATTPRLRSGCALKRLDAPEGDKRWVLGDLRSNHFVLMSDADAELLELLDRGRSVPELVREAEGREGDAGAPRLARLLSELAERDLLAGVPGAQAATDRRRGARFAAPKQLTWDGAGELFDQLHRRWGRFLLTRPALTAIAVLIVCGLVAFPYLVIGRYGTPFVVARNVGFGVLIFLAGRLAVAAVHETAHGLAMVSFGRRVRRAGLKLSLVFPSPFVDTSEAWFEPPRRRIAIRLAGPVSDLSLGAVFSLCCLALPAGTTRDIIFQVAFAAYVGALLNLNPFVERDGHQILLDMLREPGLRRRGREQHERPIDSTVRTRYAAASVAWSALAASFAVGIALRYESHLTEVAAKGAAWVVLIVLWFGFFVPLVVVLARPLLQGRRRRDRPM